MSVRKARTDDASEIFSVVARHAAREVMLERSIENIYDNLRDFFVVDAAVEGASGVVGVCSLHIWGSELAEIRSLAVDPSASGAGIGRSLVEACIDEARAMGLKKLFALTYVTGFFEHVGFHVEDKAELPQKIWGDCAKCAKFPVCDETAVAIDIV
ncbi:MAG: N-acetyltransferase [Proteobacteria bacterium]|nr:N-acetyltransferase [Pseudomonadota bacterium]